MIYEFYFEEETKDPYRPASHWYEVAWNRENPLGLIPRPAVKENRRARDRENLELLNEVGHETIREPYQHNPGISRGSGMLRQIQL